MVCYKGGLAIEQNFQMCDVTNRKIRDTIPNNKPPQVTFSCTKGGPKSNATGLVSSMGMFDALDAGDELGTCGFQFWVDRKESFYCSLKECQWEATQGPETNETHYRCETIACSCIPGRFLCGEDGSVSEYPERQLTLTADIDDFLTEEVKGPGSFNCVSGKGCSFEEPAMNQLINDIFGDASITLDCEAGECLHYSQVPGYNPPAKPDNTRWIALSISLAAGMFLSFGLCELGTWLQS
jgi:hypothetical protein